MLEKLKKNLFKILLLILIFSLGINYYQYDKDKMNKVNQKNQITSGLLTISGRGPNIANNSNDFAQVYAAIKEIQTCNFYFTDRKGISEDEISSSLPILLVNFETLILNDKEKMAKIFIDTDISSILVDISNNLDDKEAIKKAINLVK